ncbi:MAG: alkaline phosphatase family protein, partial [Ferruginibacter sp.]
MNKFKICLFSALLFSCTSFAQSKSGSKSAVSNAADKPKLIVGLVIDQMRWDFLYRYKALYGKNGFNRLIAEGFSCENTFIPYVPTYTAPGHACVFTGSVPALNGIISNNWYNTTTGKSVYCTDDSTVTTVGSTTNAGKMSPANLWPTTITDELRLSSNFQSKVFGIALKDRGSILPAGHSANAAYWYDDKVGKWITSTWYMNALPNWVNDFNNADPVGKYMQTDWALLLPENQYTLSTEDDKPYEGKIKGLKTATFPHQLSTLQTGKYEAFKTTPYAASYTFDFAKQLIDKEQMGKSAYPDFLTVSISSTDYIGHTFGPNSREMQDAYLRLDVDIANFLKHLDASVGKGNYLLFLTADHGVAHVPGFLAEHKIPAGTVSDFDLMDQLNKAVENEMGIKKAVSSVQNYQVYLNRNSIKEQGKSAAEVISICIDELKKKKNIVTAVETAELGKASLPEAQR